MRSWAVTRPPGGSAGAAGFLVGVGAGEVGAEVGRGAGVLGLDTADGVADREADDAGADDGSGEEVGAAAAALGDVLVEGAGAA